jgi:putative inorganic carbon (hco3(-)) transporter
VSVLRTAGVRERTAGIAVAFSFAIAAAAITAGAVLRPELLWPDMNWGNPLLIAGGFAFLLLAFRFSAAGLPLLVLFVFMNLSHALVRYHGFPSLLQLLVIALAFAAWIRRDTERVEKIAFQPLTILLFIYVVFHFMTTAFARHREIADARVAELVKAFIIFTLATLLMVNRRRFLQGVTTLVLSAALLGFLAMTQVATDDFSNELGGLARVKEAHLYGSVFQERIAGPVGDPNFFAQALLLVVPLPVLLAFSTTTRWARVGWIVAAAVIAGTVLLTYSRGAMVALAVMGLMLLKALHVRWTTTAALIALLLLSLILLPASVTQRFLTIEEFLPEHGDTLRPDSSFQERRRLMSVAWVMFGANPVVGVGAGNYTEHYDDYVGMTSSEARQYEDPGDLHFPHNLYLEIAAETGLAGLVLFAALLIAAWLALGEGKRRSAVSGDTTLHAIAVALRIALIGFLVTGLFLHLAFPRYLFLFLAFAATLQRLPYAEPAKTDGAA